jgi:hypothetical protein
MKNFNSSTLLLVPILLLLMRVGGCEPTSLSAPQTTKIQSTVVPSPCLYDARTDRVKNETQCDVLVRELRDAAAIGDIERMKLALKNGADADAMRDSHQPALFVAIQNGQAEAVSFLIEQGADVNANIADGYTPLKAVPLGRPDITAILVAHGAKSSL